LDAFGNPLDLTGYSVASDLKVAYADTASAASFVATIVDPPTSGSITLGLSPDATALLQGAYFYDVRLTIGSDVIRPIEGKAVISPEVTQ
jgi:hypothetical protein